MSLENSILTGIPNLFVVNVLHHNSCILMKWFHDKSFYFSVLKSEEKTGSGRKAYETEESSGGF